jgi:ankyrin repeat protein
MNRRHFIRQGLVGAAAATGAGVNQCLGRATQDSLATQATPKEVRLRAQMDPKLVNEFVGAAHGSLDKVKEMLAKEPAEQKRRGGLVLAERELGLGDLETALGGASHMGKRDIALFLLANGARIDAFCAAMLGYRDVVLALLKANPTTVTTKGPHGYTLLYHAAISGDVETAAGIKLLLSADAKDFNQALPAAGRAGQLPMIRWLLENGATDPNTKDGVGNTALVYAIRGKFSEIATELRKHGAK